jgi:uncharacterized DUF497 family protein
VSDRIRFDWDSENKKHLAIHRVSPDEFEEVLNSDPIDVSFDSVSDEERYRSVGMTSRGRILSVVWTVRRGKVRAITAFPASFADKKAFLEASR